MLRVQFCELCVENGEIVVTHVLEQRTIDASELPTPDVARTRIGPGEAVLVEDVLYAWVPPETAPRPPVRDSEPPCAEPTSIKVESEPAVEAASERPPEALSAEPVQDKPTSNRATTEDPVNATERLARISYEILKNNEELIDRHMRRMAYLDKRQHELDCRAKAIADAQVEQLAVLREVTAGFAAGVKQVTQSTGPAQLPEGYQRASDELSAASAQSIPFGLVAQHIGAFLRGAGADWFFPDVTAPTE